MSHETIYRSLFIQARGALKKELMDYLRSKRRMRRSRHSSEHGHPPEGRSSMRFSGIRERPAEAGRSSDSGSLGRRSAGRWEEQLHCDISGAAFPVSSCWIKVPSKETEPVVAALSEHVRQLPATLRRSLTWDRGLGDGQAQGVYGSDGCCRVLLLAILQSPWQHAARTRIPLILLRQYFPRGTDLAPITQAQLDQVSLRLNQRPQEKP